MKILDAYRSNYLACGTAGSALSVIRLRKVGPFVSFFFYIPFFPRAQNGFSAKMAPSARLAPLMFFFSFFFLPTFAMESGQTTKIDDD